MKTRFFAAFLTVLLLVSALTGCANTEDNSGEKPSAQTGEETVADTNEKLTTGELGVLRDEEFGNVYIELTIDEFNALGFAFGDSLDISFDNGKAFTDVPYYSGYYVPVGELLACGYPGYPHVVIAMNYGTPTWEAYEMTEDSKVTITLNEKGKYLATQELFALEYSDERSDYDSDVMFANFREVTGGDLAAGRICRSASPCDDQHNRAAYANALAEEAGIRFVLNLSDNETKYKVHTEAEGFSSEYYDQLYKSGSVLLLGMNANYRSDEFAGILSEALYEMSSHDAPCLIHCVEGKDRTGFACALVLALSGASVQEIVDDYMITYDNYFRVTKESNTAKYQAILPNVYDFLYCMCEAEKGADPDALDLKAGAESYLKKGVLKDEQIAAIEDYLTA